MLITNVNNAIITCHNNPTTPNDLCFNDSQNNKPVKAYTNIPIINNTLDWDDVESVWNGYNIVCNMDV